MAFWNRRRSGSGGDDLTALSDADLGRRYREVSGDRTADGDPDARNALLDAIAAEHLRRRPDQPEFWYDRGMYAKWRGDWTRSAEYSRRALDLIPEGRQEGEPAAWNLGIAATALHDWPTARRAWAAYGVPVPDGAAGDPILADFGPAPVRLNAGPRFAGQSLPEIDGRTWETEVVWGRRICPARIEILNVPLPDSGHRCGDIVLHDGDTVGTRRYGGDEVGVFNELLLWRRSEVPTLEALLDVAGPADLEALVEAADEAGVTVEDWTGTVRILCRACSDGSPDDGDHDHGPDRASDGWLQERNLGISADPDRAERLLSAWAGAAPGRAVTGLDVARS